MRLKCGVVLLVFGLLATALSGCGSSPRTAGDTPSRVGDGTNGPPGAGTGSPSASATPAASPRKPKRSPVFRAGNPNGRIPVPVEARAVNTSRPTRVIGRGNPASCTPNAVVAAVAAGGIITFSCGPRPVTIVMKATAKVRNANGPRIVLDGGGKVTLSGGGRRRILYMNTCDTAQGHTTSHCQDQDHPQLTVQNLTFADGNSTGERTEGGGGGAIFVRGGRFKAVNSRFVRNRWTRPDPTWAVPPSAC